MKEEIDYRYFQYAHKAVDWINKEKVKVLSICNKESYSNEGVIVFFYTLENNNINK